MDETQRAKVIQWIREGVKLSEIQNRILSEFGMKLTYMEVRFLVDDLKVTPVDPEPAPAPTPKADAKPEQPEPTQAEPEAPAAPVGVSVSVDQLTRPGALVSGKVNFSDGMTAEWYMDEAGRLGIAPKQKGYRPSQTDVQQFQMALQSELAKLGF